MIFRDFVIKNFPFLEDDFDALTDYQLFCKMVGYMKESLEKINGYQEEIDKFSKELNEFEHWFDNLDLQEEVDTKLDEMYENGQLQSLIEQYVNLQVTFCYNSVEEMKEATNLISGNFVKTYGFYEYNDGGGAFYKVRAVLTTDTVNEVTLIALADETLVAELMDPIVVRPEIYGAKGDGETDDTEAFEYMLNYVLSKQSASGYTYAIAPKMILTKKYYIDNIEVPDNLERFTIDGENSGYITNGGFIFNDTNGWQTTIENLTFNSCDEPIKFEYRNKEYGKIIIRNCTFTNCTTMCLNIARRSHQVFIEKNKFAANDKTGRFEDNDQLYFTDNWIEHTTDWEDNHFDVEQVATHEGMAHIERNAFIPGHPSQTQEVLYWLKITKDANICGNRFSDENNNIYSMYLDYVGFDNFTVDNIKYPIVNVYDNPIIGGKASIMLNKFCGVLNIHDNSFVSTKKIVRVMSDTTYNNLDYDKLTISISNNGGRQLNYKNYLGNESGILGLTLPTCLNKFIKTKPYYLANKNLNIETTLQDSHTIKIKLNDHTNKVLNFNALLPVQLNYNPGGSPNYSNNIILSVALRVYYTSSVVIAAETECLSANPHNCTFTTKINGQSNLPYSPFPSDDIEITIDIQGPYANSNILKATCLPLEFEPTNYLMNN